MPTGGSLQEVQIKGRIFSVAADADSARQLGGFTSEMQFNGDGSGRVIMTRGGWVLPDLSLSIDDARGDQEYLQDIANGKDADADGYYPMSATYASGATYSGKGRVTGNVAVSSMNITSPVTLSGPGTLTKQ
jgi:hypothetical protein